jgi:hypothetical protein
MCECHPEHSQNIWKGNKSIWDTFQSHTHQKRKKSKLEVFELYKNESISYKPYMMGCLYSMIACIWENL